MNISILHLYSNLMNLYGEYANITVLKKHLEDQGMNVAVTKSDSVCDVDLQSFDFIYIGSGTELNQKRALNDLMTKKDEIIALAKKGIPMLFTGNSFEMLGKSITAADATVYDGIGLDDFTTTEQSAKRYTTDVIADCIFCKNKIVGFINKASIILGVENAFCKTIMGLGNDNESHEEGFVCNNVIGTHVIGPILIKNPVLMQYIVTLICSSKNPDFEYTPVEYTYEENAYSVTLDKLSARLV